MFLFVFWIFVNSESEYQAWEVEHGLDRTRNALHIDKDGTLVLSLEEVELAEPGDDEVIVRVEATPINPSDTGLLLGPGDLSHIEAVDSAAQPNLTLTVPPARLPGVAGRIGQSPPDRNSTRLKSSH